MQTIEATFNIVTPMFIGGGNDDVELRPPSIKGALRFWWRAMQWGACLQATQNDNEALTLLHQREAELFGGVLDEKKKKGGQGAFLLKVKPHKIVVLSPSQLNTEYSLTVKNNNTAQWQTYLLGLGLIEYNEKKYTYLRSAIVSGSFTITLLCKNDRYLQELKELLLTWGLLGGLGSRQRKGFGSINITELKIANENIALPKNREELIFSLKSLINKSVSNEPIYTAFSANSKIICSNINISTPWQQLGYVAEKMQMFRGWGFKRNGEQQHKINGKSVNYMAHRDKTKDHNIVSNYSKKNLDKQLPNSISFGLPRSYKLSNGDEFKLEATGEHRSRRSSPVFIHIHQFSNGQAMIIQYFLPATFLLASDTVQIQQKTNNGWAIVDDIEPTINWNVINQYFALFHNWQVV